MARVRTAPTPGEPWRTAAASIGCGQVLIVMGGNYAGDEIRMAQKCSAEAKAVVLVNPGETATITSQPANSGHALVLAGDYLVIDGLAVASGAHLPANTMRRSPAAITRCSMWSSALR